MKFKGELLKFEQSEDKMMVSNNPFHVNTALVRIIMFVF